jgi:hypothetical protein
MRGQLEMGMNRGVLYMNNMRLLGWTVSAAYNEEVCLADLNGCAVVTNTKRLGVVVVVVVVVVAVAVAVARLGLKY